LVANNYVPLERRFAPVSSEANAPMEDEFSLLIGGSKEACWEDLERKYRVVILADAGAGKTEEMLTRATRLRENGFDAFFFRIEDIADSFDDSLEVGTPEEFEEWFGSVREGWFFLDSVDEAKLGHPRDFRRAMRNFANQVRSVGQRAHVYISSRPYGWQFQTDRNLFENLLPYTPEKLSQSRSSHDSFSEHLSAEGKPKSAIDLYVLRPLAVDDIRHFAKARSTPDFSEFIDELERSNLVELASRPLDLEELIEKWKKDSFLGSRMDLFSQSVGRRLDEISPDREQLQPIDPDSARQGARILAATITLTGFVGIDVPDSAIQKRNGVDPKEILSNWTPTVIHSLLHRSLFSDPLFGLVRFRHREIRELLTAEWFRTLLEKGNSRRKVESLIFRKRYGVEVINPRIRPILPWLILFDEPIRERILRIQPEIAVEGGDPSSLPLSYRKSILNEVVSRIVKGIDDRSARNNDAITRIARPDLCDEVSYLIDSYYSNDDAIFFLARVVWQGKMIGCLSKLLPITLDTKRTLYPRLVAIRAVSTLSNEEDRYNFWERLLNIPGEVAGEHIREIVEDTPPCEKSNQLLISSVFKLATDQDNAVNGLGDAISRYIDRFNLQDLEQSQALSQLMLKLNTILGNSPYLEEGECEISKEHAWLIDAAGFAVEKFVEARSDHAFDDAAIEIVQKISSINFWCPEIFDDRSSKLKQLIPAWPELNDFLFWRDVANNRSKNKSEGNKLTNYYQLSWADHCWGFEISSFERVLGYIQDKNCADDQLVALSLAFHIYSNNEKPEEMKEQLVSLVGNRPHLEIRLKDLLDPSPSEAELRLISRNAEYRKKQEQRRVESERKFREAIEKVKRNPESIRDLNRESPAELNAHQNSMVHQLWRSRPEPSCSLVSDWRDLVAHYGETIAAAFRDAAIAHWRMYSPVLRSEGSDSNSIPTALIFGITGLAIEAQEVKSFPQNLSADEAYRAARYALCEIDKFPSWFERLNRFFPEQTAKAVWEELQWELESVSEDDIHFFVAQKLFYHAPWLHNRIALRLFDWFLNRNLNNTRYLRQCVQILNDSEISSDRLNKLAKSKCRIDPRFENLPIWYAFFVTNQPQEGIVELDNWLKHLDAKKAIAGARAVITTLIGSWGTSEVGFAQDSLLKDAVSLGKLYSLMNEYIGAQRVGQSRNGNYSPIRDDAESAHNYLLKCLSELPGKESYIALIRLSNHQQGTGVTWIRGLAYERARQDSDEGPWSVKKVKAFSEELELIPLTHAQLFDVGVLHLLDLKDWLELGNDSQAHIYQKADDEDDIRKWLGYLLRTKSQGLYTCSEEHPLANDQRPDLLLKLLHEEVSPVPIELKLLDKKWSGPDLCERLRNQLRGDYIREKGASTGIFLLVWQGKKNVSRRWKINDRFVNLVELETALQEYSNSISSDFPEIDEIRCIVIDLTKRAPKSESLT